MRVICNGHDKEFCLDCEHSVPHELGTLDPPDCTEKSYCIQDEMFPHEGFRFNSPYVVKCVPVKE